MTTATHDTSNTPRMQIPYQTMSQRDFMARFGKALTAYVAQAVPPIYTGPQDTPWAPLSLLDARKPLGAQGLIAQAGAAAVRGLRHRTNRPGRPPLRGLILVAEMACGKTYMAQAITKLADELVNGVRAGEDQRPERASFFPLIVLSPPIVVEKWAREARQTIPEARVVILRRIHTEGERQAAQKEKRKRPTPQSNGAKAVPNLESEEEEEAEAIVSGEEQALRTFDPTFQGGSLSAIGCAERIARRIRADLAAWKHACAEARKAGQPLPRKPVHIVILSQSTAKLGCAWKPVYLLRPLTEQNPTTKRIRLIRDEAGNPIRVPCCPACFAPLEISRSRKRARRGETEDQEQEEVLYLTEQDLLGKTVKDRKKRSCFQCGEPLWQVIPDIQAPELVPISRRSAEDRKKPLPLPSRNEHPPCLLSAPDRRMPVADYLLKHHKGLFKTVIADEAHQYSGAGSAQGFALASLVDATNTAIGLTGTLFGGYSSRLFPMLWRLSPELRQHFSWQEAQRWVKLYGVEQRTYKQVVRQGENIGAVSKRREEPKTKELPGVSPMVLRHVLPCALFLELADVVKDLPPYTEQVVSVPLGPVLEPLYEKLERESTLAIRQLLARGDHTALSAWFHGLMTYPNLPWEGATIAHPRRNEVLGSALPLPEEVIYPKERALLERIRQERSEGRRTLIYVEHTNKHDLLPRLKRLIEEDDKRWRIGLPVEGFEQDGRTGIPKHLGGLDLVRVKLLRSNTVSTAKRETWLEQAVEEGCDVLICHSGLVEVGLDLLAFPTICCYEVIFSTTRLRQASRRSYRPGQKLPVRVFWFNYDHAMEARGLLLIARKITASLMVEGKLPGGESMTTQVLGKGGGNPLLELAQSLIEDTEGSKRLVAGSLEAALREMQEAEQQQDELIGGEAVKEALVAQKASTPGQAEVEMVKEAIDGEVGLKVPHSTRRHPQEGMLPLPETAKEQATNSLADPLEEAPTSPIHQSISLTQPSLFPDAVRPMVPQRDGKAALPVAGATLWDVLLPQQADSSAFGEISPADAQDTGAPVPVPTFGQLEEPARPRPEIEDARPLPDVSQRAAEGELPLLEVCVVCGALVEAYSPEGQPCCFAHYIGFLPSKNAVAEDGRTQGASVSMRFAVGMAPEARSGPSSHQEQDEPQAETIAALEPDQRIIAALQYLAGVCDGARALDGHGFNKQDAGFGHSLAAQSLKKPLSQKQLEQGFKLLGKYQGQLREAGLTLPTRKEVERWFAQMAPAEEATVGEGTISIEGEHLLVRFPRFDPHKVQRIKAIRARFGGPGFDAASRVWVLPLQAAETLLRMFPVLEGRAAVEQYLAPRAQQPVDEQSTLEERLSEITVVYQQLYERQPDERLMRQRVQTFAEADHWLTEFKHRLAIKQQARRNQPTGNADPA
jgi:hypothetical protein